MQQDAHRPESWMMAMFGGLTNAHYAVVAGSFVLTIVIWLYASSQAEQQAAAEFDRQSDQILELTTERMQRYEDALWAGVAALYVTDDLLSFDAWQSFSQTLQINTKYPGINGIGVILKVPSEERDDFNAQQRIQRPFFKIGPPHAHDILYPITFIEPQAENIQAVGLDMAFEERRFRGLMAARDTGDARITESITLVQDARSTPGFLFFAPFYHGGFQQDLAARQANFAGAVYAPFVVEKLMQGVLDPEKRGIWIRLSDGSDVIYDEHDPDAEGADAAPMFQRHATIPMYGRNWTVDMRTTLGFRAQNTKSQPAMILFCGIIIDFLLLFLFAAMARSNKRIYRYADKVTAELQREKRDLQDTNEALEQFSYVTAHDLRTPLRGMRDTTEYLIEKIEAQHPEIMRNGETRRQFGTLQKLTDRMESLVAGVLDFAQLTNKALPLSVVHTELTIRAIAQDLGLGHDRLTLVGPFPDILFAPNLFTRIFQNLLSNAKDHCDDRECLRIVMTAEVIGADVTFTVVDNGPGIDPRHHQRIFEMFQMLNPEKSPQSIGVGLAIAQKATKLAGGRISLDSAVGRGATFSLYFPGVVQERQIQTAAE